MSYTSIKHPIGKKSDPSMKGSALPLILILLVVFVVGGFFVYKMLGKPEQEQQQEKVSVEEVVTKRTPKSVFSKLNKNMDCKEDMKCFISAVKDCKSTVVISTASIDILGVTHTTTSYFEVKGKEEDKCNFYIRTDKVELIFPDTVEQKVQDQQTALYKKQEGRDGICKFDIDDLVGMLTRWKEGTFDSGKVSCKLTPEGNDCITEGGDFGNAECTGSYFETTFLQ